MAKEAIELGLKDANAGCACCATGAAQAAAPAQEPAATTTLHVEGMTCSHCVSSVTEELSALPGVQRVSVDLVAGGVPTVTVDSDAPLDADAVAAAVDEAGYTLAGRSA
jgi:copper chaperone CopZ